jgi:hypothetical protein
MAWDDDEHDPSMPHGTVLSVVERQRGLSAGAAFATVRWDSTGSTGRHSLGMLRVLSPAEDALG